jgi:hypothetical protein
MKLVAALGGIKRLTLMEILVSVVFVLYIVLPITTPRALVPLVQSPLGLVAIFLIVLYLFLFAHPLLAILYLIVAYLLLRRSSSPVISPKKSEKPPTLPTIPIPENSHIPMSTSSAVPQTLEEDVISQMAPVGQSGFVQTSFLPVASSTSGASAI